MSYFDSDSDDEQHTNLLSADKLERADIDTDTPQRVESRPLRSADESYAAMHAADSDAREQLAQLSARDVSARLYRLAREQWRLLGLATGALVLSSIAGMAIPKFAGNLIDAVSVGGDKNELNKAVFYMFVALSLSAIFAFVRNLCFTLAGERVVARLRKLLFDSIMQQEIGFFDQTRTGELANRLASDAQIIQNAATVNISMALRMLGQLLAGIVFLFVLSWKLTLVMLCVIPPIVGGASFYGRYVRKVSKQVQDALAKSGEVATEVLGSIRTVRSFSNDENESRKYAVCIDESYRLAAKRALARGSFAGVATWLGGLAVMLVLWYGGKLVIDGELSPGTLTSFVLYTLTVSFALGGLMELLGDFMKSIGASERVFQLIDRVPKLARAKGRVLQRHQVKGSIDFENVTFRYPTRPDSAVLTNFNLQLRPGKVVALCGPSGGGKSTVVSLLLAFYAPQEGKIIIDGFSLDDLNAAEYRRYFAVVSQEPTLFAASIADNIAYGSRSATDEEIIAAAKVANAHEFIDSFDDGYRTMVGERGIKLSGGQKQRIAIARAVLRDPVVLLLDEATSALDAESEHLVKEALDKLMVGRTVLVIAHRLSTVINSNQVVVVQDGRVEESGTHHELMQIENGLYRTLVSRQLKAD